MKILHIGDIHLGCTLENLRRNREIANALNAVCALVREHHVEGVLLAGDIFDSGSPSADSLEIYYSFLGELLLSSCRNVIIISGNHDSAAFLDAPGALLRKMNIHIVGKADPDHPEKELILLRDGEGNEKACICAVPYLRERDVRKFIPEGENAAQRNNALKAGVSAHYRQILELAAARRGSNSYPIIGMGHFFATGSSFASAEDHSPEGESVKNADPLTVGNLAAMDLNDFAGGFSYMALGHIHKPQCVAENPLWRYAGSILPMNLQENGFTPQVVLLDTENMEDIQILPLPESCYHKMCVIRGNMQELRTALEDLRRSGQEIWVKPLYTGEEHLPNWALELRQEYNSADLQILSPEVRRNGEKRAGTTLPDEFREARLESMTPEQLFLAHLEKQGKITQEEQKKTLLQLFRSACERVQDSGTQKENQGKSAAGEQMKFKRLFIRNVNSLYGDNLIDFEAEDFNSGIFLISGNTGSGKTSILDAICLALYGCTPRVSRISDTQDSVMSEGCNELSCELTFSLGKTVYRACFHHVRTRENSRKPFRTPEHKLFRNGLPVEISNIRGIREEIIRLTGMTESEFTRCVLLAQGSFDAFLKSGSAERSEILKSITGTGLYTRIGQEIHQSYTSLRDQFLRKESELQNIVFLPEEEKEKLTLEQNTLAETLRLQEGKIRECSAIEDLFKRIESSSLAVREALSDLEKAENNIKNAADKKKELTDALRAQHCLTEVNRFRNAAKQLSDLQKGIRILQEESLVLEKESRKFELEFQNGIQALETLEKQAAQARILFREIRLLDHESAEKNKLCAAEKEKLNRILTQLAEAGKEYEKVSLRWEKAQKQNRAAAEYLEKYASDVLLEQKNASWEQKKASLDREKESIRLEQENLDLQKHTLDQQQLLLQEAQSNQITTGKLLEQKKACCDTLREEEKNLLAGKTPDEIRLAWAAAEKLSAFFRGTLRRNEFLTPSHPCPLCGSKQHPYCEGTAVPPQEEAEATYDRTAGELKKRLTLLRKCMESLAAAEKELASLNLKYQEHAIKAEHLKQQLLKEEDGYRQKVLLLSQRRQENDTQIRDLVFETALALRTEERDPSILSQLIQKRITTFHRAEQAVNALAGEQQIFEQGSAVYETLQNQLRQQQEGHETTLAALEQEIISIQKERREKFKDKSPDQESAALEEALKKAQTKYTDSQRNTVRAKEKYDNSLLNQEKQLRLLRQQEIEYSASENDLLGILQKYDFTTLQEWELFNRSPEVIHSLTNLLQKMDLELQHCKTVLEERKGLHAKLSAELEPGLLREENQKKLAELLEAEKDLREKHSAVQVRLRLDQEARSLHEKKLREVEEERHLLNHWKCLYDDFGSTPGTDGTDRFGRIAQGYTFRELLYYANRNLMGTLRKRFTLINDNTDPLELNVIDHCRADQERTSRNLSGGESFEVSLALALGLSEMSSMSQNAKLGNVLLDEGFGTLDDQALESALELLMNLKNTNGKLVGIISHVEKLKERIATQIEVQSSSGMGSLSGAGVVSGEKLSRYLEESGLPGTSPGKKRRKKR